MQPILIIFFLLPQFLPGSPHLVSYPSYFSLSFSKTKKWKPTNQTKNSHKKIRVYFVLANCSWVWDLPRSAVYMPSDTWRKLIFPFPAGVGHKEILGEGWDSVTTYHPSSVLELCLDCTHVNLGHDATVSAFKWAVALLCPEDAASLGSSPCLVLTVFLPPRLHRSLGRKGEVLIKISHLGLSKSPIIF